MRLTGLFPGELVRWGRTRSIRTVLAVLLIAVFALVAVPSVLYVNSRQESLTRRDLLDRQGEYAASLALAVGNYLHLHAAALEALAVERDSDASFDGVIRDRLRTLVREHPEAVVVGFEGPLGEPRIEIPTHPARMEEMLDSIHVGVRRTLGPRWDVAHRPEGALLLIGVPSFRENGAFRGSFAGILAADRLDSLLVDPQRASGIGAFLLDRNGKAIVRLDSLHDTAIPPLIIAGSESLLAGEHYRPARGRTPRHTAFILPGAHGPALVGIAPVADTDWRVIVERDEADVLGPLRRQRDRLLALLLGGAGLAVFAAIVVTRRLTAPLAMLAASSRALAEGQFDGPLPTGRFREIRELTAAMDEMRRRLAARNAELEAANRRLEDEVSRRTVQLRTELDERGRAEASARESEAVLRTVVHHLPIGVWYADAKGQILYGNPEARRIWAGERLVGVERYHEYKGWWAETGRLIGPDEWALSRALRNGEISIGELIDIECFDGTRRTIMNSAVPLRDSDGRITGGVVLNEDVTRKLRMERAAAAAHEASERSLAQLRAVLSSMTEAVVIATPDGRSVHHNPASLALHGYHTLEEALAGWDDQAIWEALDASGHRLPRERHPLIRALHGERFTNSEVHVRRTDTGKEFVGSYGGTAITDRDGTISLVILTVRDVTEKKRSEAALVGALGERAVLLEAERAARAEAERANRLKDEFLATLSHELRTPLSAILGWVQLLRRGRLEGPLAAEALEVIERSAETQRQLIEDLLDMSRIISGKLRLEMRPLDLEPVVQAAAAAVRPAAEAKEIRFSVDVNGNLPPVRGDASRIQQALWNLLTNAVKFTPTNGSVILAAAADRDRIEISVTDSGVGIETEFLPFVFDRFRQADAATTRRYRGLGLGLSIVKEIAELHGGGVRVASPGPGKGATFTLELPAAGLHAMALGGSQSGLDLAGDALSGCRVLVVDDDRQVRVFLERVLAESGAEVEGAGSAAEARAALSRAGFDLLVSDIGMPDEDGNRLIQSIREAEAPGGRRLAAIAVTAFARPADRESALAAGFDEHMAKPLSASTLITAAARLVERIRGASRAI